jgi:hypothetical protein
MEDRNLDKKNRMLNHITNNIRYFMKNPPTLEVISFNDLSKTDFITAKESFAYNARYEDVVCLISTSVFETGKSGILFTTSYVYTKAWGIFTEAYQNSIYRSEQARFGNNSDFSASRMREIMSDLSKTDGEQVVDELLGYALNKLFDYLGGNPKK